LRKLALSELEEQLGKYGVRLYELARGIDENLVVSERPTQSISVEDTFEQDVLLTEIEPMIRRLAESSGWPRAKRREYRAPSCSNSRPVSSRFSPAAIRGARLLHPAKN